MDLKKNIMYILTHDVKPAVGCTEPVAIAYAAAICRERIGGAVEDILVKLCPNVYKNGMNVGIPGIDIFGLDVAGVLGVVIGNSERGLQLLSDIDEDMVREAKELLRAGKVQVELIDTKDKIHIEVELKTTEGYARAVIRNRHDELTLLEVNGEVLFCSGEGAKGGTDGVDPSYYQAQIADILRTVEEIPAEELQFMMKGFEMNRQAVARGLAEPLGIGVGYALQEGMKSGTVARDLPNTAMMMTAAASDARMSGLSIPVMSSNGSGNHGLTAIVPIIAYDEIYPESEERLSRAIAISHLMTAYIKHYIGRLSPLCGCSIAASTGSAVGIAWLMGAGEAEIQGVVKNIIANQAGVICDGAKAGCALKLATATSAGVMSALLATKGYQVCENNGIVTGAAEETIRNLGKLSEKGLAQLDSAIISIMEDAEKCI